MEHRHDIDWFSERMDRDSRFIEHRFAVARRRQARLATNELDLSGRISSDGQVQLPVERRRHIDIERTLFESGVLISAEEMPTPLESVLASEIRGCLLPYNHGLGSAIQTPFRILSPGQGSPPDDIEQKFYFENLTPLPNDRAHTFRLTSIFPLADKRRVTIAHFPYRFHFSIGSSGMYCFLPLPEILGNVAYSTTDTSIPSTPDTGDAQTIFGVEFGVRVGGSVVAHEHTGVSFWINNGELLPIGLTLDEFLTNDANYRPVSVELDAADSEAEIDVRISVSFLNGPSYYEPNDDGHFFLDCESLGGQLGCEILKWGRWVV